MPRNTAFDAGKAAYRQPRAKEGQQCRHYLSNDLLLHYGASEHRYAELQHQLGRDAVNYRMGLPSTNGLDTRIDNRLIGTLFTGPQVAAQPKYKTYDATALAQNGLNYKQQGEMLGARFETAKDMYSRTGEHKYYMVRRALPLPSSSSPLLTHITSLATRRWPEISEAWRMTTSTSTFGSGACLARGPLNTREREGDERGACLCS